MGSRRAAAWLMLAAGSIVVAILLVAVVLLGSQSSTPSAAGRSPSETDQHAFTTEDGLLAVRLEDSAIVVERTQAGETVELGRGISSAIQATSPGETFAPEASAAFGMLCGGTGPTARRY